jgi:hypothetical protein
MKAAGGEARFPHIDAVVYITEKHYQMLPDGRTAFALGIFESLSAIEQRWKVEFIDLLVQSWSRFRTGSVVVERPYEGSQFETIEDIPEKMPRSDAWRLEYKRGPYLCNFSDQQLKVHFNRCVALSSVAFVIGSWAKPTHEETAAGLRLFTDAIEEINRRSLDMRDFSPKLLSSEELQEVHKGLPDELVAMLSGQDSCVYRKPHPSC